MENVDLPSPRQPKKVHDLDLGDGHWLDWSIYKDSRCGGIITHTSQATETGFCSGAFWTDGRYAADHPGRKHDIWAISGPDDRPTLSPSFRCHCGDHGYIRDGKWVRA